MTGNLKFKNKLLVSLLACGILLCLALGIFSVKIAGNALTKKEFGQLTAIRQIKKHHIETYFNQSLMVMKTTAESQDAANLLTRFIEYHGLMGFAPDQPYGVSSPEYNEMAERYGSFFLDFQKRSGFYDVLLICAEHGHVMFSCAREKDLGTNLGSGEYKDSGLAELWKKVVATQKPAIVDFKPYAPSNGEPASFVGIPVFFESGAMKGLLVFQLSIEHINEIMQERTGLGKTGETFLTGSDYLMRSDLFADNIHHSIKASFADPVQGRMETKATRAALSGETGEHILKNFRGENVLSAFTPFEMMDLKWALVAEIHEKEALESVRQMEIWMIIIAVISFVVIILGSLWLIRMLYLPLDQTTRELKTTSEELRTAAQQQLSSTTEQATATTQIATVFEELSASSGQVLKIAEAVVASADTANSASAEGKKSLDNAVMGNEKIKAQVEKVVENMLNLGKKTKQMDLALEIINELSSQTTILSYNATIEAEGAGKEGRRFSALAELIMKLANRAVESSKDIKTLIEDVQKSANTTLLATEDGMKAVASGTKHVMDSSRHFDQILMLSEETLVSAKEIEMTIFEQNSSLEQTAQGVQNIHLASEEVKTSSDQTLKTAEHIFNMSEKISNI